MIPNPVIGTKSWTRWSDRESLYSTNWTWEKEKTVEYGGVYIFGNFLADPPLTVSPHLDECAIYIGMTKNLSTRPRKQHEKINRYRVEFRDEKLQHLYIALYDVTDWYHYDPSKSAYLAYLERKTHLGVREVLGKNLSKRLLIAGKAVRKREGLIQ